MEEIKPQTEQQLPPVRAKSTPLGMSKNSALVLTTVKIHPSLAIRIKDEFAKSRLNYQKLINRSFDLYINDQDFRNKINSHLALVTSGSL